jgi:enoyl-CoA hydratase
MPAVYCEIVKYAIKTPAASELTLFGRIYDLEAASRMGIVQKSVPPEQLLDAAVAWAAHVPPDCYPAYSFSKRASSHDGKK